MPRAIIIGGPNGAGKTTASRNLLLDVERCIEFVNADEIARGISPFNVDEVALQAGKLMLSRMHELRDAGRDFAFESTMASRSFAPFLRDCKSRGYAVHVYFFALPTPEQSIERVRHRVNLGGHNIPTDVIFRRHASGAANFADLYLPLADNWASFDASHRTPRINSASDPGFWTPRSLLAVQKGVETAAIRHKQAGVPMVVADDNGNIREIPADEIVIDYDILNAPYPEV